MVKPTYLSSKAIEELGAELHELKFVRQPAVSREIGTAREHGDISENAEYDAAKEEQGLLQRRIAQLEEILATARPLEELDMPEGTCYIGCTVSLEDLDDGSEEVYTLVAPPEADPRKGTLSVESPIGSGLLGREVGDIVSIPIPAGEVRYRIISVGRNIGK
ncbi:transcription elongation factor GreA [Gemmatimonadota bacterium]